MEFCSFEFVRVRCLINRHKNRRTNSEFFVVDYKNRRHQEFIRLSSLISMFNCVKNILQIERLLLEEHEELVADRLGHDDATTLDATLPAQTIGRLQGVEHIAPLLQFVLGVTVSTATTVLV